MVVGSIVFGAWYLGSLIAYSFADKNGDHGYWPLALPGIGPFLTLGTASAPLTKGDSAPGLLLVIDGVLQTGGIIFAVLGFTDKKTVLIRNDAALRVTPIVGRSAIALGVSVTL